MILPRIVRAGCQSGSIMIAADITTQLFVEGRLDDDDNTYSPARTLRWAAAGVLLHGPYFYTAFSWLDKVFGGTNLTTGAVLKKTAGAQVLVFPPYLFLLFGFLGLMEGRANNGVHELWQHVWQRVPDAFLMGCAFWPVANLINFALVVPSLRVPYVASVGSVWNILLSRLNRRKEEQSGTVGSSNKKAQ